MHFRNNLKSEILEHNDKGRGIRKEQIMRGLGIVCKGLWNISCVIWAVNYENYKQEVSN